jgi:hypothetical protein
MAVAQEGGKDRQVTLDVEAAPVPSHQGLDRQAVAKVVQTRPAPVVGPTQAG